MRRGSRRLGVVAMGATAGLTMVTAGLSGAGGAAASDDVTVTHAEIRADGSTSVTQTKTAVPLVDTPGGSKPAEPAPPAPPQSKLDRGLAAAVKDPAAAGRVRAVVTFRQDVAVPRFPDLDPDLPRSAATNVQARARGDAMVGDLAAQRAAGYRAISADLAKLGVRTLETYWLAKAMTVDAPASALTALAQRADVTYVQPASTRTPPPADSDPDNDEFWARWFMRSDPYFNLGLSTGYIGILDTGVRATHTMFNFPTRPWIREDMVNTTSPNPDDDFWNHGTSTMGVITGNNNSGATLRGVTGITTDSFKVYDSAGAQVDAVMRGFQRAIQVGDRVIAAELQFTPNGYDSVQVMADQAFDAGAVVVAANGNFGRDAAGNPIPGSVNSPAAAQKVLGIGSLDVGTGETPASQSLGPAPDGRTKPDLQAPTNVETASNASDTATRLFTGTSAATPHAAGTAAMIRNLLRGSSADVNPGSVYAFMIATGNSVNGSSVIPPINNTSGAGAIRLPVGGHITTAAKTLGTGQTAMFPITVEATDANDTTKQLNVAIWWAEEQATHNDVDLTLVDPNGFVRGSSLSVGGVFERVHVVGPLTPGNWTARVNGFSVPGGSQLVHLAAVTTQ